MDADQTIRDLAVQYAMKLALSGTEATSTDSIITEAEKIANFINSGTVPA